MTEQCERRCDGRDIVLQNCFPACAFNSKNDDDQLNVSQHFIQYSIEMDFQRSFAVAAQHKIEFKIIGNLLSNNGEKKSNYFLFLQRHGK